MNEIENAIYDLGGRQFQECYHDLCIAIEVTMLRLPERTQMKVVCSEICCRTEKDIRTVAKSLSRAVIDLWDFGDRDKIIQYCRGRSRSKPAPREFIYAVARELKSKGPEDE